MRIGIISDSHGDHKALAAVAAKAGQVDLWLHAGDCAPDADYLQRITEVEVVRVLGNCDWPNDKLTPAEIIETGSHKIFLTHGHLYGVNFGLDALEKEATQCKCDIAVYGHTHIAGQWNNAGVLILNPGSISRPRGGGAASFMVLEEKRGELSVKLIELI